MSILEKGLKLIKEVSKIPELKTAFITESNVNVKIQGLWTIRNYAAGETNTLSTDHLYRPKDGLIDQLHSTFLDKRIILTSFSPCGLKTAHIFQDEDCCFINIVEGLTVSTINLKNEDLHGKVYKDDTLSSFCWSSDSVHLAFLAEKKRPKPSSYMSKPSEATKDGWGKKYSYIEDWGEQLTGYCQSVIVVVNTVKENISILDLPDKICCGEVVWTPEQELLGVGYSVEPYKLGLKYCPNRESLLFKINLSGEYDALITGGHVQSPRFSPDGNKVVFLQNPVGGPHVRSSQLCLMDWKTKEVHVVVDYVNKHSKLDDESLFYGFYGISSIPQNCWSEDSTQVVVSSPDNFCMKTYLVNVDTKNIRQVPLEGSTTVHDVKGKYILVSVSSLTRPAQLVLFPFVSGDETFTSKFIFICNENEVENIPKDWQDQWTFVNPNPHPVKEVSDLDIPVIYFGPTTPVPDENKRPLIVWVHGGPHSILLNKFNPIGSIFVRLGYSIVIPNYRGSLGQGRACLESLPGNCGTVDVDDVFQAVTKCLERYVTVLDKENVFLYGGSHGGFLVTHLSGQHPGVFRAVSARNPVVDIASMSTVTDIPDWNFVESGNTFEKGKNLSSDFLKQAFEKSPMKLVDNVKTPTLILLGTEDRRVPMNPGLFYYRLLRAREIPTELFVYDDSHALAKPDVEVDAFLQTIQWYFKHSK